MQLGSVWSDLYDSTLALYSGRAGGHRWLVAVVPEQAQEAAQVLEELAGKGEVTLLVYAGLTPLEAALREQTKAVLGRGLAGALVVDRELVGGPAVTVSPSAKQASRSGLSYHEGGSYPAWTDAQGRTGVQGECPPASVCAALSLPVQVCAPERLRETLTGWWAATPHALVAG